MDNGQFKFRNPNVGAFVPYNEGTVTVAVCIALFPRKQESRAIYARKF